MCDTRPLYGSYERVDVQGIAASLKTTSEYTFTVVHLYQNWVEACVRVNFAFEDLALQFPRVQFLRVRASEAILGFKNENLPALMIYKHTKHQDTLVRITENLGNDISTLKMAHLLAQYVFICCLYVFVLFSFCALLSFPPDIDNNGLPLNIFLSLIPSEQRFCPSVTTAKKNNNRIDTTFGYKY